MFSHDAIFYSTTLKRHLDKYGKQIDCLTVPGREDAESHLYLYDFSANKESHNNKFKTFIKRIRNFIFNATNSRK